MQKYAVLNTNFVDHKTRTLYFRFRGLIRGTFQFDIILDVTYFAFIEGKRGRILTQFLFE